MSWGNHCQLCKQIRLEGIQDSFWYHYRNNNILFNEKGVDITLEKIGMSREELLSTARAQVDKDSNREKILRNLGLF